jgi:hypothetical protein
LREHEELGGHTLGRHTGFSAGELTSRLAEDLSTRRASSFPDQATAEDAVASVLEAESDAIAEWLGGDHSDSLVLRCELGSTVGLVVSRPGEIRSAHAVQVLLFKDVSELGYRIHTAYPI